MVAKTKKVSNNMLKVTLLRSTIGSKQNQIDTVQALGLKKINSCVEIIDNPANRGKIFVVKHLVAVEEIGG